MRTTPSGRAATTAMPEITSADVVPHSSHESFRRVMTRLPASVASICRYLTRSFRNALVQQHCACPAPATPDESLARTRTM